MFFERIIQNYLEIWLKSSTFAPNLKHDTIMKHEIQERYPRDNQPTPKPICYYVTIRLYSEPNCQGNCSLYYYGGKKGSRLVLTGRANKKLYVSKKAAMQAQLLLATFYHNAIIEVEEYTFGDSYLVCK